MRCLGYELKCESSKVVTRWW